MSDLFIAYDPSQPAGERLAPEVVEEIKTVAPSTVVNGGITTAKLADKAVTTAKLADGSVTGVQLASGAVDTVHLAAGAVETDQLADGAVTVAKVGPGVATAVGSDGSPLVARTMYLTASEYAAIATKDPNTTYAILG